MAEHRCGPPMTDHGPDGDASTRWRCPSCARCWRVADIGIARYWTLAPTTAPPRNQHPAPEVAARGATAGEIPRGALALIRVAQTLAWGVEATYARGTLGGRTPQVVESLAVRLRSQRSGARGWAIWHDGRFATAVRLDLSLGAVRCGYRELLAWVQGGTS